MSLVDNYPGLADYLAGLPNGLDSYPECTSKGSLLRSTLEGHPHNAFVEGLPPLLAGLIDSPPPPGIWRPAVHGIALVHAVCDRFYPTEEDILLWGRRRSESMAANRLYRAVLRVSSPRVLFRMTTQLNGLLQRGTTFVQEFLEPGHSVATLYYPARLHTRRTLLGTVALSRMLVELTGGRCTSAELTNCERTHATFETRWEAPPTF